MNIKVLILGLIFCLGLTHAEWHIETLKPSEGAVSLVLDTSGYPCIAYSDSSAGICYAYWDGSRWYIELVDTSQYFAGGVSLEHDASGNPHISYGVTNAFYLPVHIMYAYWNASSWSYSEVEILEVAGTTRTSLALDSSGYPHISFRIPRYLDETLKYAHWDGLKWNVDSIDSGAENSLALDDGGYPHISYQTGQIGYWDLRYAYYDGVTWHTESVDTLDLCGTRNSLTLDSNGYPHIAYSSRPWEEDQRLKYVFWDGSDWQIEIVDTLSFIHSISLALDANENPNIAYTFDHNGMRGLQYALRNEGIWTVENVQSNSSSVGGTSLALDPQGNPRIAYTMGSPYRDLKYAWQDYTAIEEYYLLPPFVAVCTAEPNPFTVSVTISFELPEPGYAELHVFDLSGKLVTKLFSGEVSGGSISRCLDGSNLPVGVYITRLQTEREVTSVRLIKL